MNLIAIFLLAFCLQVSANGFSQTITLREKAAPIEKVMRSVRKQSGYSFVFHVKYLKDAKPVTINIQSKSLEETLQIIFNEQPFTFKIEDKLIVIKPKKAAEDNQPKQQNISGKVIDENGMPLQGATVKVKGSTIATTTDKNGNFNITVAPINPVLIISYMGYEAKEINGSQNVTVTLIRSTSKLDEVQVMAYGTTTQRLNTGSITKVTAEEIARQPVSNPLAALQGRVAGLIVSPTTGVPGAAIRVELRGQNSLAATISSNMDLNSDPLFIIDGIPFAPNNANLNRISSIVSSGTTTGGLSPLHSINPNDIESIEVLKDADATAIYGSRGGNGVILITTKKGKAGTTSINANFYTGVSQSSIVPKFINTEQYIEVRKEALMNDGVTPTISNAYDLLQYDQMKYTDIPDYLIGGTANTTDGQLSINGGSEKMSFLLNGSLRRETTVLPTNLGDTRAAFHLNVSNILLEDKLRTTLTIGYSNDVNKLSSSAISSIMTLPPNTPDFVDENGTLQWYYNDAPIQNVYSNLTNYYQAQTNNLISNLQLNYKIAKGLNFKSNFGYNKIMTDELTKFLMANQNPAFDQIGSALFGRSEFNGWSIEPHLEVQSGIFKGKINLLAGATWQVNHYKGHNGTASGYTNDALVGALSAAASITNSDDYYQYKYQAFFGRINYNWQDRYIANITGRRDGSSRFGPDRQFGNFGAIGAAWIFSNEKLLSVLSNVLSYGKLRGSYGITGTDAINNYQFLDSWRASNTYQGSPGLNPTKLANDDYSWEQNKKAEIGLELGFLNDRILLTSSYFRNVGDSHLVNYPMPSQTGFTSITQNFPAVITNSGWEFTAVSTNIATKNFSWKTSGNISFTQSILTSFPNIELSPYNVVYKVGQSTDIIRGLESTGIDPQTGLFKFTDIDGNGTYSINDYVTLGNFNPKYFGGINNSFSYKNIQLDFFLEFKKQLARNFLSSYYGTAYPGARTRSSFPVELLDRWQKPGDIAKYQKYTAASIGTSFFNVSNSITISDASYLRLKTAGISYSVPQKIISKLKVRNCRMYLQGQNLLVITGFEVTDPETRVVDALPPLRTITAGLQLTL